MEDRITFALRLVREELEQLDPLMPGSSALANGILKGLLDVLAQTFLTPEEHAQVDVICDLHTACMY
ncbi:MAG: hypothetical protein ABI456_16470 [Ktedonobacteraceae bacterium]